MYTGGIWVIVALLVAGHSLTSCSAVSIAITPDLYTEQSTGFANISCRIDAGDNDVKTIFMIEILKGEEEPLVYLQAAGLSYGASVTDRLKFRAEGLISTADVTKSFLKLAILEPSKQDGGLFTCKLVYADIKGLPREHHSSDNLTVEKLNLNDVVRQLLDQLASVQRQLDTQTDAVSNLTDANRALTQQMADKDSMADVVGRVSSLEAKAWIQSEELANRVTRLDVMTWNLSQGLNELTNQSLTLTNGLTDLTDKVTYSVAFSASLNPNTDLTKGQTLVFDNVLLNEGNAYDGSTGIFTCPRNGYYVFHVAVETRCGECYGYVNVKADNAVLASLYAYDKYTDEQTSNSFVAHLMQGAKVKVEAWWTSKLDGDTMIKTSLISGYLVRAD